MNPAIPAAAGLAFKGGRWGYRKLRSRAQEKKCIKTITKTLPDDASRQEERETRCIARLYCSGKAESARAAEDICHRRDNDKRR